MNEIKKLIDKVLAVDKRIWVNRELNQTLLLDLVDKIDVNIIGLLLENEIIRATFFVKIRDSYVFKTNEFKFFMEENKVNNSFTTYKNRIGLTDGKRFLKDTNDVVLDFPYKDCILEGGQSNEDGLENYYEWQEVTYKDKLDEHGNKLKDGRSNVKEIDIDGHYALIKDKTKNKRNEVFFNKVLAKDEIDRLLDDKALVNWKRFTANGECNVGTIKRDDDGVIKENLIIKGNNLLALHSLKKQFVGKVKLIYIDPPYNTGNDSFAYNDKFNHSTWLTFMKNRLEVAMGLLNNDGVVAVQCSFHEYAYLKVLMDEIFTLACELCTFNIQVRHPDRILTGDKPFNDVIEYVILYSKSDNYKFPTKIAAKLDEDYIYQVVTHGISEIIQCGDREVEVYLPEQYQEIKGKANSTSFKTISVRGSIREKNSSGRFYVKHIEPLKEQYPPRTLFKVPNMGDDIYDFRYFHLPVEGNKNGSYYQGKPTSSDVTETPYANFYNFEKEYNNVSDQGGISFRNGKKPEEMIGFLIGVFTKLGDIVLDYHLGSGTTAAVAHKMGRQYIGIEQMDYIEDLAVTRLKNVIGKVDEVKDLIESETKYTEFDNSGISKAVNWQGGGEFIYCELAKWNEQAQEQILACNSFTQLKELFDELYSRYFLNYNLKIKEFQEKVIKEPQFTALPLEQQKEMFLTMLDLNQMYVQKSEMADSKYGLSESDISLTELFYKKG